LLPATIDLHAEADELNVEPAEASLSKAQTRTTSKRPRRASRIIWSSHGRRAFAPLMVSVQVAADMPTRSLRAY